MPATRQALQVTDRYRASLIRVRDDAVAALAAAWTVVDPDAVRDGVAAWLPTAEAAVAAGQQAAAALAAPYLSAFLTAELGDTAVAAPVRLPTSRTTRDRRPLSVVLAAAALLGVATARRLGRDSTVSLTAGVARAARLADTEVLQAGRGALAEAMAADDRIRGWRRATSGAPCNACAAAAGQLNRSGDVPDIHPHCSCTAEPVVAGVPERFTRNTTTPDSLAATDAAKGIDA